jgi:predicted lipoprotein with Yx(FWY)xxD motif
MKGSNSSRMPQKAKFRTSGMLLVLVVALGACSSPSTSSGLHPKPGKAGLTIFSYKAKQGTVVGSIYGVVAYTNIDQHGSKTVCTGSCTSTWHPWLTQGAAVHAGPGVRASEIGHVTRSDGGEQITYGGHALYLYAFNKGASQANAEGAGGVWYVVSTSGQPIK